MQALKHLQERTCQEVYWSASEHVGCFQLGCRASDLESGLQFCGATSECDIPLPLSDPVEAMCAAGVKHSPCPAGPWRRIASVEGRCKDIVPRRHVALTYSLRPQKKDQHRNAISQEAVSCAPERPKLPTSSTIHFPPKKARVKPNEGFGSATLCVHLPHTPLGRPGVGQVKTSLVETAP